MDVYVLVAKELKVPVGVFKDRTEADKVKGYLEKNYSISVSVLVYPIQDKSTECVEDLVTPYKYR